MRTLFRHRWISGFVATLFVALGYLLIRGDLDLSVLVATFVLSVIAFSYPSFLERFWQSRNLPPGTIHVPASRVRNGSEWDLMQLFLMPEVYSLIKSRYSLKTGDAGAPGLFLYIYLPSPVYEVRNLGPDTVYSKLAEKLKEDLDDPSEVDLIAQRNLPLAFGFRFLPKNAFAYHDMSKWINIIKQQYFRENTWIRGVLQSKKRQFRIHSPEDNEFRTFLPYLDESLPISGGPTLSHDFRSDDVKRIALQRASTIEAERVEYPERIPFGSLLTYAKKGEISLQGFPEAVDKLYIDRINVLLQGPEHRKEILQQLSRTLGREVAEEDFYPLFNYGQRLRGYMPPGKSVSDSVSSRGNFALHYNGDRGWVVTRLEPGLILQMQEAYWSRGPAEINGARALSTSRATLITGAPDSLLQFQVSTGTPTRGQIFAADEMIENKVRAFAVANKFQLQNAVGSGAEGLLYLAAQNDHRYYLKSPDGQLAQEEIETIEVLKQAHLIPEQIRTYKDDRMIVMPEYPPLPAGNGHAPVAPALLFEYVRRIREAGFYCLDLTPEHVRTMPEQKMLFLIDFSGYIKASNFEKQPKEYLADRKKIEYRTPEEITGKFPDFDRFQIYLLGLLLYQILREDRGLPDALQKLENGPVAYTAQLAEDLKRVPEKYATTLGDMLAFETSARKNFADLKNAFMISNSELESFWQKAQSEIR